MTTPTRNQFPIDDERMLVNAVVGIVGNFGLMAGIGLMRMPIASQGDVFKRAEWVDVLAKIRGMSFAETLYRFAIVRQHCGCRVIALPSPVEAPGPEWPPAAHREEPPHTLGRLVTCLCDAHPYADLDGTVYRNVLIAWIVDRQPESHGARRQT